MAYQTASRSHRSVVVRIAHLLVLAVALGGLALAFSACDNNKKEGAWVKHQKQKWG